MISRARIREEVELKAVHEMDLENYLSSLGLLDALKEGKFNCKHCKIEITLDNFLCIYPIDDEIVICCDNPICYRKALIESKELNQVG